MKRIFLTTSFLFALGLTACSAPLDPFFISSFSSGPSYAILEGISYNSESSRSEPFVVSVLIANLYYGKTYKGDIDKLVSYNFDSIEVSFHDSSTDFFTFDVDMAEYSSQENGILQENARSATADDFEMAYDFDLSELFLERNNYTGEVIFSITYNEKRQGSENWSFSRGFTGTLTIDDNTIMLSDVEYDYF